MRAKRCASTPPRMLVSPCAPTSVVDRTTLPALPQRLDERVVGLGVVGGLGELDVVGDRARAIGGDLRKGAGEGPAREREALVQLVEGDVVDPDDDDVPRHRALAADREARVDGRQLAALEHVGGVEQQRDAGGDDRDREQQGPAQAAGRRPAPQTTTPSDTGLRLPSQRSCVNRRAKPVTSPKGEGSASRLARGWLPASRWSTTSCSTCAAPSGCSRRSARPGPTPTSSRRSTTRRGPRAASPTAACTPRSCSACARRRARSARCCRCIPTPSSPSTCAATTPSSRPRARGRTECSSTQAPPTSATATTPSATPGASARRRWRRAGRWCARCCGCC